MPACVCITHTSGSFKAFDLLNCTYFIPISLTAQAVLSLCHSNITHSLGLGQFWRFWLEIVHMSQTVAVVFCRPILFLIRKFLQFWTHLICSYHQLEVTSFFPAVQNFEILPTGRIVIWHKVWVRRARC